MTEQQTAEKLERNLRHAVAMENRARTRVKRASTLLHRWALKRKRIERRIGEAEVAKNRQAKGERIGTSRLTAAEVRQIRVLREAGLTLDAIAEAIGVSRGAVNHV